MNVFLIAAMSADGFIGQDKNQPSLEWTSPEDKQFFANKTKQAGVVVMGRNTFATIGRPLSERLTVVYTHCSKQELGQLLGSDLSQYRPDQLQVTQLNPDQLVEQLTQQGYGQLAVCGGASIYSQFLQTDLVDELFLTIEPIMFGQGIRLSLEGLELRLKLKQTKQLNNQGTVLLNYQTKK